MSAAHTGSMLTRAIYGEPSVVRALQGNQSLNRVTRGSKMLDLALGRNTAIARLTRPNPALDAAMRSQLVLDALNRPSLIDRLNASLEMARGTQIDYAALTATMAYGDVLRAALRGPEPRFGGAPPAEYEATLADAESTVVAAFDAMGLNGREELDKTKAEAQADLEAMIAERPVLHGEAAAVSEPVLATKADLDAMRDLLAQLLAEHRDEQAGHRIERRLALAAFVVAIVSVAISVYTWQNPVTPPAPAPARPTHASPPSQPRGPQTGHRSSTDDGPDASEHRGETTPRG